MIFLVVSASNGAKTRNKCRKNGNIHGSQVSPVRFSLVYLFYFPLKIILDDRFTKHLYCPVLNLVHFLVVIYWFYVNIIVYFVLIITGKKLTNNYHFSYTKIGYWDFFSTPMVVAETTQNVGVAHQSDNRISLAEWFLFGFLIVKRWANVT